MSRVVSKDLFHFKPTGKLDEDVNEMENQEELIESSPEMKEMYEKSLELIKNNDDESNKAFVDMMRGICAPYADILKASPKFTDSVEQTITTSITIPTSHDGDFHVPVEVYTPKDLQGGTNNCAYIYAHGGAGIAMAASDFDTLLKHYAVEFKVVVYNVDYRIAPETRCPNNVKDFYEAVKYISKNGESLGVDPAKIVIAGDSGGGYICLGTMVMLAENDESHLVKLAIPGVPMVDDYCFSDTQAMTKEERINAAGFRKIYQYCIAGDWEEQKNSPYLFPGKASDNLLEKFPPTIIMECEFDQYITEATRLAGRLRRAGRLLEFVVIPGAGHASSLTPSLKSNQVFFDTLKTIAREYIHAQELIVAVKYEFDI